MEEQRKSENALVPALRFEGFSDPWEQRKVGEILQIAFRAVDLEDDKKYQLVTVKRRNEGIVERARMAGRDILVKSYQEILAGDFVISKRQLVHGGNGLVPPHLSRSIVSNEYLVIEESKGISTEFWALISRTKSMYRQYFLSSFGVDIEKLVFDVQDWKKREITFPKRREQEKLETLFQKLDSLIALHQRKHEKLKTVKQSLLEKMFPKEGEDVPEIRFEGFTDPWEQRRLGEISESYSGGTPSVGNESYYGGDIPFIRSAEISSDSTELRLTEKGLDNSSAALVESGCVLYALYGATSGEVAISRIRGAINQAILAIVPSKNNNAEFIAAWLRREKPKILDTYLQGGQGNLSGAIVKDLTLALPSGEEQSRIGALFQKLDSLIALHQRELDILKNLKQALLEKMFV